MYITKNTKIELKSKIIEIAQNTRNAILSAGIKIDDLDNIAKFYKVRLLYEAMGFNTDGYYSKTLRSITLNSEIIYNPRVIFSFFHELMHHMIDINDDLYELIYNSTSQVPNPDYMDAWIENFCNIGASEILMPSEEIQKVLNSSEFSPSLIPLLYKQFNASSIAIAYQLLNCSSHKCYLAIAELCDYLQDIKNNGNHLFETSTIDKKEKRLKIIYSGKSGSAEYSIAKNHFISKGHILYSALNTTGLISGEDKFPSQKGTNWTIPCQAIYFQERIFAFFNETAPRSNRQLSLFD